MWLDRIRVDVREIVWEVEDWIHLAQDRDQWRGLMNTAMKLRVLLRTEDFLASFFTVSFSRRTLLCGVIAFACKSRKYF
jgi:hypothetical protein